MPIQEVDHSPAGDAPRAETQRVDGAAGGGPEAVSRLERQFEEFLEYVRLYAAARGDALVAALRRLGLRLAVAAMGLVVLSATVGAAVGARRDQPGGHRDQCSGWLLRNSTPPSASTSSRA